jgi:hypothetical protein
MKYKGSFSTLTLGKGNTINGKEALLEIVTVCGATLFSELAQLTKTKAVAITSIGDHLVNKIKKMETLKMSFNCIDSFIQIRQH